MISVLWSLRVVVKARNLFEKTFFFRIIVGIFCKNFSWILIFFMVFVKNKVCQFYLKIDETVESWKRCVHTCACITLDFIAKYCWLWVLGIYVLGQADHELNGLIYKHKYYSYLLHVYCEMDMYLNCYSIICYSNRTFTLSSFFPEKIPEKAVHHNHNCSHYCCYNCYNYLGLKLSSDLQRLLHVPLTFGLTRWTKKTQGWCKSAFHLLEEGKCKLKTAGKKDKIMIPNMTVMPMTNLWADIIQHIVNKKW